MFIFHLCILEKEIATHSSILAWKIPWTEEPGGLEPRGSQRVRHDWAHTHTHTHTHTHMYLWLGVCEDLWPIFKSGWLLIVDFENFFVFLYNSHLSDMSFENIFSQSAACLLFLLKLGFTDQNFLNKVQVINYFFMNCALDVVSINVLPCPVSYRFSPMLFSNSFTVVYFKSGLWSILN